MPATLTYPGVYIEEIPSGVRTIVGVATSITAFVGYTSRGPLDRAVRIHNFGDFEREFGGLYKDSLVSYAVQQFFLNGGSDAYVVRVAKNAKPATVIMKDISGTEVLKVSAASHGVWANDVRMDIDYATSNPDSTFNLTVTRYETRNGKAVPVETERHINLSMNSESATYAVDVVNAASKIISLERLNTCQFDDDDDDLDRGWSLSGNLKNFSPDELAAGDTISGVLNGTDPFTLTLPSVSNEDDVLDNLNNALTIAIKDAGLSSDTIKYLAAFRVDANGKNAENGNFIKLISQVVEGNDTTTAERSSVRITNAPAKLLLGLNNGGREKECASQRRPAPTGTVSKDLSYYLDQETEVYGSLNIQIMDNGPSTSAEILPVHSITLGSVDSPIIVGTELGREIQEKIRNIDNPATKNATVQFQGPILRIQSSADTPNASIELTGKLNIDEEEPLDLNTPGGHVNIQQYRLGTGATFGAQSNAEAGFDGTPPGGSDIIGSFESKTGIYALRDVDLFNLMVIPETTKLDTPEEANSVIQSAIAFCEDQRAFFIIDPPELDDKKIKEWAEVSTSRNAALFFPQIKIADPLSEFRLVDKTPSGAVAGIFARTDSQRGVWKAPAGTDAVVKGAQGLRTLLTDLENGPLNQAGVNCLRKFPVYGIISWGARTRRGADEIADEYKYIPVRRLALYIEESLYRGLKWVVFEPNDEPLWSQIRLNVGAFMHNLFRQGAFQGTTPKEAYFVKCDKETTTQNDINLGIVNIVVGFAPLKPAEFVVIKIQQMAGQVQT